MKPTNLSKDPDFKVYNWGLEQIDLTDMGHTPRQMIPTECHIRENGSISDEPTLLFVMENGNDVETVVAQISLRMFQPVLDEIAMLRGKSK